MVEKAHASQRQYTVVFRYVKKNTFSLAGHTVAMSLEGCKRIHGSIE